MRAANILTRGQICLLAAVYLGLAAGCATAPPHTLTVPACEAAMVSGSSRTFSFSYLCKVDGHGLGRLREWHFSGHFYPQAIAAVPVNPGRRTLTVYCEYECFFYYGCPLWGMKETELTVDLAAGHHYQIQHQRDGCCFIVWLEDLDTHELAGEKKIVPANVFLPLRP